jgi:hypothetical protein
VEGFRYIVQRSGSERRIFRVDIRETISRNAARGDVTHYASVNLSEIQADGTLLKVAYADSPHIARGNLHWFHAHNAEGEIIQESIPTAGFTQSALPGIMRWSNAYTRDLFRVGAP